MATDRDRKLPDYRTIPSLQDILVVSSSEPRMEHYRREPDGRKIHDLLGYLVTHFGFQLERWQFCGSVSRTSAG